MISSAQLRNGYKPYTNEEDLFIINNYGMIDTNYIGYLLGRTSRSVQQRASRLRTKKPKKFRS